MNLGCLITTDKIVTYTTIFENTSSNMKRSKMKALIDSAEERDSMSSTLGYLSGMVNLKLCYNTLPLQYYVCG